MKLVQFLAAAFALLVCAANPVTAHVLLETVSAVPGFPDQFPAISPDQPVLARAQAMDYRLHAAQLYPIPGPKTDPWNRYVREAAVRFRVPKRWIFEVMRQESSGLQHSADGALMVSPAGAMGLMQIMPGTFAGLRARYALGDDPFDPRTNIMAGAAYIRELSRRYGSPGFLAAYNAGPFRVDAYLAARATLPDETVAYITHIARRLGTEVAFSGPFKEYGVVRMTPDEAGMQEPLPNVITPGRGVVRHTGWGRLFPPIQGNALPADNAFGVLGDAMRGLGAVNAANAGFMIPPVVDPPVLNDGTRILPGQQSSHAADAVFLAPRSRSAPLKKDDADSATVEMRQVHPGQSLHGDLVPVTAKPMVGAWKMEIGRFADSASARDAIGKAQNVMQPLGLLAHPVVTPIWADGTTKYRVELVGLAEEPAVTACDLMIRQGHNCMTVPPGS